MAFERINFYLEMSQAMKSRTATEEEKEDLQTDLL